MIISCDGGALLYVKLALIKDGALSVKVVAIDKVDEVATDTSDSVSLVNGTGTAITAPLGTEPYLASV